MSIYTEREKLKHHIHETIVLNRARTRRFRKIDDRDSVWSELVFEVRRRDKEGNFFWWELAFVSYLTVKDNSSLVTKVAKNIEQPMTLDVLIMDGTARYRRYSPAGRLTNYNEPYEDAGGDSSRVTAQLERLVPQRNAIPDSINFAATVRAFEGQMVRKHFSAPKLIP